MTTTTRDDQDARARGAIRESADSDGFAVWRLPDGTTAEFGPAGDRLTDWQYIGTAQLPEVGS